MRLKMMADIVSERTAETDAMGRQYRETDDASQLKEAMEGHETVTPFHMSLLVEVDQESPSYEWAMDMSQHNADLEPLRWNHGHTCDGLDRVLAMARGKVQIPESDVNDADYLAMFGSHARKYTEQPPMPAFATVTTAIPAAVAAAAVVATTRVNTRLTCPVAFVEPYVFTEYMAGRELDLEARHGFLSRRMCKKYAGIFRSSVDVICLTYNTYKHHFSLFVVARVDGGHVVIHMDPLRGTHESAEIGGRVIPFLRIVWEQLKPWFAVEAAARAAASAAVVVVDGCTGHSVGAAGAPATAATVSTLPVGFEEPSYVRTVPRVVSVRVPQQGDFVSCGVFVATFVRKMLLAASLGRLPALIADLLRGASVPWFDPALPLQRRTACSVLIRQKLDAIPNGMLGYVSAEASVSDEEGASRRPRQRRRQFLTQTLSPGRQVGAPSATAPNVPLKHPKAGKPIGRGIRGFFPRVDDATYVCEAQSQLFNWGRGKLSGEDNWSGEDFIEDDGDGIVGGDQDYASAVSSGEDHMNIHHALNAARDADADAHSVSSAGGYDDDGHFSEGVGNVFVDNGAIESSCDEEASGDDEQVAHSGSSSDGRSDLWTEDVVADDGATVFAGVGLKAVGVELAVRSPVAPVCSVDMDEGTGSEVSADTDAAVPSTCPGICVAEPQRPVKRRRRARRILASDSSSDSGGEQ